MTTASPPPSPPRSRGAAGPVTRPDRATVDLLGVLAYGELSAFDRLAEDARQRADAGGPRRALGDGRRRDRSLPAARRPPARHGVTVEEAMAPFVAPLDSYHASTRPRSWLESLVKAYVGDGLAADFYREVAAWVSGDHRGAGAAGAGRHRAQRVRRARGAGGVRGRTGRSATGWRCGGAGCSARR